MHHVTFLDEGEEKSGLGLCLVQGKFQSGHVFPIKKKKLYPLPVFYHFLFSAFEASFHVWSVKVHEGSTTWEALHPPISSSKALLPAGSALKRIHGEAECGDC